MNTLRLRSGKAGKIRPGHPWIYKGRIQKPPEKINPGEVVSLLDAGGKFIGRGYFNPKSEIAIRLLTFKDEPIGADFFKSRMKDAVDKRGPILGNTNAYRAVFSEADSLPGLIVDVYSDTVVFQVLTFGMERLKSYALDGIRGVLNPKFIYENSSSPFRRLEGLKESRAWHGAEGRPVIEIFEGRAHFLVDIEKGHKTGFYLDQRRSRLAIEGISKEKRVLDLFCYTGGFSVNAAMGGAKYARGIDIKKEWLDLGRANAGLNGVAEKIEFIKGDAFHALKNIYTSGEKFDIIVLDPPSFVKSRASVKSAAKGYKELNVLAMKMLDEGGILATFSCSHNMPGDVFAQILKEAAREAEKKFIILKRCHQDRDHPIVKSIPETEYLKGYFLTVTS